MGQDHATDSKLIRGRYVLPDPSRPDTYVANGAVYVESDRVKEIGEYDHLRRSYPGVPEIGSDEHVVLPGLINAHDHGRGLSTALTGIPDRILELWMASLGDLPAVDPYLSAAYHAATSIEAGITTVLNSYFEGSLNTYEDKLAAGTKAYREAGLRVVWALQIVDRSPIKAFYEGCLPDLPPALQDRVRASLGARNPVTTDDYFALCRTWQEELSRDRSGRISLLMGPSSVNWCSDDLLLRLRDAAEANGTGMHTHLLETPYQQQQALKEYGETMVAHLAKIGFLGPKLSGAHCVWVTERDIDLLAKTGTSVVHNPGSNLRLGSGIAPVEAMLERGVNVAIGLDSNSLNDNCDMLQEMRLAAGLHHHPGRAASAADAGKWFSMASAGGARALLLDRETGVLAPGKKADIILVSLKRPLFPYAAPAANPLPLLLMRAEAQDVDSVLIGGQLVMHERKLLTIEKDAIAAELRDQVASAVARQDSSPSLIQTILPYAARPYEVGEERLGVPFCHYNCREVA